MALIGENMFTTIKTPQDAADAFTEYFSAFPKTEKDIRDSLFKVKKIFETEIKNSNEMWGTYQKAIKGDATPNEIAEANKKAQELLKATQLATFLTVPGSIFFLPAVIKLAKDYGVDLIPESVSAEFKV